jgi:hypothetical protein
MALGCGGDVDSQRNEEIETRFKCVNTIKKPPRTLLLKSGFGSNVADGDLRDSQRTRRHELTTLVLTR